MIGIICNYYIKNYGSVLQSFALQYILDKMAVQNEIICYQEKITKKQRLLILVKIQLKQLRDFEKVKNRYRIAKKKKRDIKHQQIVRERNEIFEQFVKEHLRYSKAYNTLKELEQDIGNYGGIILGSDQLWCPSDLIISYHTLEWIPDNIYTATYATSFGVDQLNKYFRQKIAQFIPKINKVSVREMSAKKLITKVTRKKVKVVLDPTLLLDKADWDNVFEFEHQIKEPYIFCYFLSNNMQFKEWAQKLQEKTGLQIVFIPHLESYDEQNGKFADIELWKLSPKDLINLIRNADYILSDSFHVTIFSIIYEKKFLVFDRYQRGAVDSRNTRIDNLLSITGLERRHYTGTGDILTLLAEDLHMEEVLKRLKNYREASLQYLQEVAEDIEKNEIMEY